MQGNQMDASVENAPVQINTQLLRAAVKLNTLLLAGVFGCASGLALLVITYISMNRGLPDTGHYLNLLGVFLPGYSVTPSGALIGFLWAALFGALIGVIFYRIYARSIESEVRSLLQRSKDGDDLLDITLRLDGHYLGLAVGGVLALGLLVTTNWLVFRGTAEESIHAILLANYLPGYSVSPLGSLVGAVELFVILYLLSVLFSWIYNLVARLRGKLR